MAPVEPASDSSSGQSLTLPEVIFSCGICQATVSEVYATPESNKGFHSGPGDDDGIVTRLWIAECSHVSCGKHLAGGAAPFHLHGEQPQAPCPQCLRTGDETPKNLYGIRGLDESEHDPSIPRTWFQCPPIRLDGSAPGMDAVRFQYMALARYSQKVHDRWKTAETKHAVAAQSLDRERRQRKQLQDELSSARLRTIDDAAALAKSQAALEKWEKRMPVINSLMAGIKPMADDMHRMRSKLAELGFDVPKRDYGLGVGQQEIGEGPRTQDSEISDHMRVHDINESSSSSRKRKRDETQAIRGDLDQQLSSNKLRRNSRDMMPPPPIRTQPRREMQIGTASLPMPRTIQDRETIERPSNVQVLRRPVQDAASSWDMPSRPTRLLPNAAIQSNHRFESHVDEELDRERSPRYAHGYAETSSRDHRRLGIDQHGHGLQSARPHPMRQNNRDIYSGDNLDQQLPQPQMREPLQDLPVNMNDIQTPSRSSRPHARQKAFVSPLRANQPTAGSVSSPFFQRETGTSHVMSIRRPLQHGGDGSHASSQSGLQYGGTARLPRPYEFNDAPSARDRPEYYYQRLQPSSQHECSDAAPSSATLPYRGHTTQPQTSNYRLFDGQPYGSGSRQPLAEMQQFPVSRGRITLPPSKTGVRDYELSSIQGLCGGRPQRADGLSMLRDSGYSASRPLFSSASRRSVRR